MGVFLLLGIIIFMTKYPQTSRPGKVKSGNDSMDRNYIIYYAIAAKNNILMLCFIRYARVQKTIVILTRFEVGFLNFL